MGAEPYIIKKEHSTGKNLNGTSKRYGIRYQKNTEGDDIIHERHDFDDSIAKRLARGLMKEKNIKPWTVEVIEL